MPNPENLEEQAIEKAHLTCLNFLCLYISEVSIGAVVTVASYYTGAFCGTMSYSCDQYIGYPVGPSPANDLTVPPTTPPATTCPPQLDSNSSSICFGPKCEEDVRTGEKIGAIVGVALTAAALAATGLFQAGYLLKRRLDRATQAEKRPILHVNTSTSATDGRINAPSRQMRSDSRTSAL